MRHLLLALACASGCTATGSPDAAVDQALPQLDLARPECADGVQDGNESDVDCGGSCAPCPAGARCGAPSDCGSKVCAAGRCGKPSCTDGVQNGNETDIDCGGSCAPCPAGDHCVRGTDCQSGVCAAGACAPSGSCTDGVQNGFESDVDCGGPNCPRCPNGERCGTASDCASAYCDPSSATCAVLVDASVVHDLSFQPPDLAGIDARPPEPLDLGAADLASSSQFVETQAFAAVAPSLVVGDFDADGRADVAGTTGDWQAVAALLGNGDGTLQAPILSIAPNAFVSAGADFDEDGRLDLLCQFVLKGMGDGRFAIAANGGEFAGDFDRDGHVDVIAGSQVRWGDGKLDFEAGPGVDQVLFPTTVVADFDGDGAVDALSNSQGGLFIDYAEIDTFTPQRNEGSWDPITSPIGCGDCTFYQFAGDFDGDGATDLVVLHAVRPPMMMNFNTTVEVWRHLPGKVVATTADTELAPFFAADFDGDGKLDALASGRVWLGHGDGTFTKGPLDPVAALAWANQYATVSGDFNRDGKADLAIVANLGNNGAGPYELRIFLSRF